MHDQLHRSGVPASPADDCNLGDIIGLMGAESIVRGDSVSLSLSSSAARNISAISSAVGFRNFDCEFKSSYDAIKLANRIRAGSISSATA